MSKEQTRRNFLKWSALGIGGLGLGLERVIAAAADAKKETKEKTKKAAKGAKKAAKKAGKKFSDAKVKLQNYIHNINEKKPEKPIAKKAYERHQKDIAKELKAKGKKADVLPMCINCKQYKKPEGEWGQCVMVGAMGQKGKWVYEKAWCQVWQIDKSKIG